MVQIAVHNQVLVFVINRLDGLALVRHDQVN